MLAEAALFRFSDVICDEGMARAEVIVRGLQRLAIQITGAEFLRRVFAILRQDMQPRK